MQANISPNIDPNTIEQLTEYYRINAQINLGLTLLCVLILFVIIFISMKVLKFTKMKSNKAIIGMLIFLILDIISNISFYGINTNIYKQYKYNIETSN